jgi:thiosulfate/3-mercaptopyruvate sulfurtransferase
MKRIAALLLLIAFDAVAAVRTEMLVSTKWLADHPGEVRIVHVGADYTPYEKEHIAGASFISMMKLVTADNELPPVADLQAMLEEAGISNDGSKIVIYGDDPLHAARLFFTLDYLGQGARIALLDGGLEKWKAENRPVTGALALGSMSRFKPRVDATRLVTHADMRKLVDAKTTPIIDARPEAQFRGDEPGDGVNRPGHIPGAKNVFWKTNLAADGTLLPEAQLRTMYDAPKKARVVTYCRTGMQSSFTYFVLRYLGYNAAMYDGSFLAWSNDADAPVEK